MASPRQSALCLCRFDFLGSFIAMESHNRWSFACWHNVFFHDAASSAPHSLFFIDWHITDILPCVSLRSTMYWLDTFEHCNMITTVSLANMAITSHNYHFSGGWSVSYLLSQQGSSTECHIVNYNHYAVHWSPGLIHLIPGHCTLWPTPPHFPLPSPWYHDSTLCFCEFIVFRVQLEGISQCI